MLLTKKAIRAEQISRAEKMVANGTLKKQRKNPNDPARFVNKVAVTNEGKKPQSIIILIWRRLQKKKCMMDFMPSVQTCLMMMLQIF